MAQQPQESTPESNADATRLALASLDPDKVSGSTDAFVEGVVTLLWPYSQSSARLSLLLCEQDFRLRISKGQLRVDFNGPAARAVNQENVQIGDVLRVSVAGATMAELQDASPRDVPWSIAFDGKLLLRVKKATGWTDVLVDEPAGVVESDEKQPADTTVERTPSPGAKAITPRSRSPPSPSTPPDSYIFSQNSGRSWATPGMFKRSADFFEPSSPNKLARLFDEEEGAESYDAGHRRKRQRFSSAFRMVDRTPSPSPSPEAERSPAQNGTADAGEGAPSAEAVGEGQGQKPKDAVSPDSTGSEPKEVRAVQEPPYEKSPEPCSPSARPSKIEMPPPSLPTIFMDTTAVEEDKDKDKEKYKDKDKDQAMPDSPSLRPIASPGLPLISPFLHQGLSAGDYMEVDKKLQTEIKSQRTEAAQAAAPEPMSEDEDPVQSFIDMMTGPDSIIADTPVTIADLESAKVSLENKVAQPEHASRLLDVPTALDVPKSVPSPPPPQVDGPGLDYESERDSLFDDTSDTELPPRKRARSKSPIPKPSPLRNEFARPPPPGSPPNRPKPLNLKSTSPHKEDPNTTPRLPHETPFLYLPTPSPKITSGVSQFPFSGPATAPPVLSADDSYVGGDGVPKLKRKLFSERRESAPTGDLSAYFGRTPRKSMTPALHNKLQEAISESPSTGREAEPSLEPSDSDEDVVLSNGYHIPPATLQRFDSGTTTSLSEFPSLAQLQWGTSVDVIGIVVSSSGVSRAKQAPHDHYMSIRILDSSLPAGVTMHLFRPFKEALPTVAAGDVVMLRSFKITTRKRKPIGQSTENSAWAVWADKGKASPPAMAGPPVEYGDEEEKYVEEIGDWYQSLDDDTRVELEKQLPDNPKFIVRKVEKARAALMSKEEKAAEAERIRALKAEREKARKKSEDAEKAQGGKAQEDVAGEINQAIEAKRAEVGEEKAAEAGVGVEAGAEREGHAEGHADGRKEGEDSADAQLAREEKARVTP